MVWVLTTAWEHKSSWDHFCHSVRTSKPKVKIRRASLIGSNFQKSFRLNVFQAMLHFYLLWCLVLYTRKRFLLWNLLNVKTRQWENWLYCSAEVMQTDFWYFVTHSIFQPSELVWQGRKKCCPGWHFLDINEWAMFDYAMKQDVTDFLCLWIILIWY